MKRNRQTGGRYGRQFLFIGIDIMIKTNTAKKVYVVNPVGSTLEKVKSNTARKVYVVNT